MKRGVLLLLVVALVAPPARAGVFDPGGEVLRVSIAPHPLLDAETCDGDEDICEPPCVPVATLEIGRDGIHIKVRTLDTRSGDFHGEPLVLSAASLGIRSEPVDVLLSTVFRPGSLLVLDAERRVHVVPLGFKDDHTPFVPDTPDVLGPLGSRGQGTVLGEVPDPGDAADGFLSVGTSSGDVLIVDEGVNRVVIDVVEIPVGERPVLDVDRLAAGTAGAVVDGSLVLVDIDADERTAGLQPAIAGSLRDPRDVPLIDFASDGERIVAANGTTEIASGVIPADPFTVWEIDFVHTVPTPVKQVVLGSITMLAADGSGVLYNRAFTPQDGFAGRLWTIGGASMTVDPQTLNLRSRGRPVTVRIEVVDGGAAAIDPATLRLSVDGVTGSVPASPLPEPVLTDHDGDGNPDLEAKFDRAALTALLAQTQGATAVVRAAWDDGATASVALGVLR